MPYLPPDDPPFSLLYPIKQVLNYARIIFARLRPCSDVNDSRSTTNSVTRMRFHFTPRYRFQEFDGLPIYVNHYDIEMQSYQPQNPVNLDKTLLNLAFQAVVAFASSSTWENVPLCLFVKVSIIMAFAASFSGIFLRHAYPRTASIIEKIGSIIAAVGFFAMASVILPGDFTWVSWLAFAFCTLALLSRFIN